MNQIPALCVGAALGMFFALGWLKIKTLGAIPPARAVYETSEIVSMPDVTTAPDIGYGEYVGVDWLRSRAHFRQPDGMTIVGYDMLVWAINDVNKMHAELLTYRKPKPGPGSAIIESDTAAFAAPSE